MNYRIPSDAHLTEAERAKVPRYRQIFSRLDAFLRDRFRYKTSGMTFYVAGYDIMYARRKKYDVYLRFKDLYRNQPTTLVIARIGFDRERKGHGTALVRLLTCMVTYHQKRDLLRSIYFIWGLEKNC